MSLRQTIRNQRAYATCKAIGHTTKLIEVIDKADYLGADYLGHPSFMVTKRHFICRRCCRRVAGPNAA